MQSSITRYTNRFGLAKTQMIKTPVNFHIGMKIDLFNLDEA